MTINHPLIVSTLLTGMAVSAQAGIIIDGNLADWGVHRTGNASDWTPNAGIERTIEDQHGSFLDPGFGGQAYDAEALYAFRDAGYLYIALATGHNPNTANNPAGNSYGAGDFAIDFGKDGSYELGINIKPNWDSFGVAGGVYSVSNWSLGLWNDNLAKDYVKAEHPTSIQNGSLLGQLAPSDLAITNSGATGYGQWSSDTHFFYEMRVSLGLLQAGGWNGDAFNIHWTQNCANDSIIVDPPAHSPAFNVAEPASLVFFPLGLVGMLSWGRRRAG